jgi:hypothetical protein
VWPAAISLFLAVTRRFLADALLPSLVAQIFFYYLASGFPPSTDVRNRWPSDESL